MSFLEPQVSFPLNLVLILSVILYFLSSNIINFRVLKSKFVKFLISILNWQVSSFSNFASFFIVATHNSPVNFKLIHFLPWIKGPNKSLNFETFMCSGENLPSSSCYFPNHKSLFLKILNHSLVSWNVKPLYFFSWNIKVQIFETFQCSSQNSSNSLCQFWNDKSILLQMFHHFSVSLHITPL